MHATPLPAGPGGRYWRRLSRAVRYRKKVQGRRRCVGKRTGHCDPFPLKPIPQLSFFIYSFMTFPLANGRERTPRLDKQRHHEDVRGKLSQGPVSDIRVRSKSDWSQIAAMGFRTDGLKLHVFGRKALTEIVHHEINQPAMRNGQYRPGPFCGPDIGIDDPVSNLGPARRLVSGSIVHDDR